MDVVAKAAEESKPSTISKTKRHAPILAPLSGGVVTSVKWYPAIKAKRHAIPSPSSAHMFGGKRNYIKLQG